MIEIIRFRLRPGGDEAEARAVRRRAEEEFFSQQPGLLGRTIARADDGSWIVIMRWRSDADADAADSRGERDELVQAVLALMDKSSVSVERYQEAD